MLVLFLLACFTTDVAQAQTVLHTVGVLEHLEAGDIACYASLVNDEGYAFNEMANFEVCDRTDLIGQRVNLSYEIGTVLAASCEGDFDCGKSDTVVLISAIWENEEEMEEAPTDMWSELIGSWEPLPGETRRREIYTFNSDGTLIVSDGTQNRELSWMLEEDRLYISGQQVDYGVSHVGLVLDGAAYTNFQFLSEVPTTFASDTSFRPSGYFSPKDAFQVDDVTFFGAVIAPHEMFDTGEEEVPAFLFDFATPDGAYLKVLPTAFHASASEVTFIGHHEQLGEVQFFGSFEKGAFATALASGTAPEGTTMLNGHMLVKGHLFYDLAFTWAP